MNSRSNSSVIEDFSGLLADWVISREVFCFDCSIIGSGLYGFFSTGIVNDCKPFVLRVLIKFRISKRSSDVKLEWLWFRDIGGDEDDDDDDDVEWHIESEQRLSRLKSRLWGLKCQIEY